eukprot:ctg_1101.g368
MRRPVGRVRAATRGQAGRKGERGGSVRGDAVARSLHTTDGRAWRELVVLAGVEAQRRELPASTQNDARLCSAVLEGAHGRRVKIFGYRVRVRSAGAGSHVSSSLPRNRDYRCSGLDGLFASCLLSYAHPLATALDALPFVTHPRVARLRIRPALLVSFPFATLPLLGTAPPVWNALAPTMKRIVSYNDSLAFVAEIQGSEGLLAPVTAAEADDDRRLSQDAAEADASPSRQRSQRKDASVAEPLATGTAVSGAEDQLGQRPPRRSEYGAEAGSSSRRSSGKLTSPSPQLTAATAAAEPSAPEADLGSRSPSLRRWPSPWPADACAAGGHAPPIAGGTVSAQAGDMHGWPMVPEGAEREWPRSQLDADGGVGAAASSFREVYIEPESPHAPGGIQDAFLDPHPTAASDAARYGASPQFMAQVQAEETAAAARPLAPTRTLANDAPSTADEAAPGDSTRHADHLPEMARPAAQTLYMVRKLVIVMVGLPARGKSHIAQQLARYLNWLGHRTSIFNVGVIRRRMLGESGCDASFFAADNPEGMRLRWLFAQHALTEMLQWLFEENGQVGIFDATNSTVTRRRYVREHLERYGVRVLFLESIVDDERIVEQNILATKLNSPDYRHKDAEFAVHDFKTRLRNYEQASETITESEQDRILSEQRAHHAAHGVLVAARRERVERDRPAGWRPGDHRARRAIREAVERVFAAGVSRPVDAVGVVFAVASHLAYRAPHCHRQLHLLALAERDQRGHLRGHDLRADSHRAAQRVGAAQARQAAVPLSGRRVVPGRHPARGADYSGDRAADQTAAHRRAQCHHPQHLRLLQGPASGGGAACGHSAAHPDTVTHPAVRLR